MPHQGSNGRFEADAAITTLMRPARVRALLKSSGWLLLMAILFDSLAISYWLEFITTGTIHDGKHGLTFLRVSATGHLVGATIGGIVCTYYAVKSLLRTYRQPAQGT